MSTLDPHAAVPGARPRDSQTFVMASASLLAIVVYIHRLGFAVAAGDPDGPFHLSDRELGDLMSAFLLGYGLLEMPWGILADRLGVAKVLAPVVIGGSLLTALPAALALSPRTAWAFRALLVCRFLFGAFQAGTFPSITRLTADWIAPESRGRAQGFVWTASRLGGAIAPFVMAQLVWMCGDSRLPLVLIALLGVAWTTWFLRWYGRHARNHGGGQTPRPGASREWSDWIALARNPGAIALCVSYGCLGFSGNFFVTLLPGYLAKQRGLETSATAVLTALPFAFGMAACLAGGMLSDRLVRRSGHSSSRRAVGFAGMALAGSAIALVPWCSSTPALAFLLTLAFAGNDLAMAPAWAAAADIDERKAGALSGAMNMASSVLASFQTRTVGRMFSAGDLSTPFILLATGYLLGALAWFAVVPHSSPRSSQPDTPSSSEQQP